MIAARWAVPILKEVKEEDKPSFLVTSSLLWKEPFVPFFSLSAVKTSQRNLVQSWRSTFPGEWTLLHQHLPRYELLDFDDTDWCRHPLLSFECCWASQPWVEGFQSYDNFREVLEALFSREEELDAGLGCSSFLLMVMSCDHWPERIHCWKSGIEREDWHVPLWVKLTMQWNDKNKTLSWSDCELHYSMGVNYICSHSHQVDTPFLKALHRRTESQETQKTRIIKFQSWSEFAIAKASPKASESTFWVRTPPQGNAWKASEHQMNNLLLPDSPWDENRHLFPHRFLERQSIILFT